MRVLVAGSAGLIGSNVVRILRDNGICPDLCDKRFGWDARDVRDGYDLIYDCAAPTRGIGSHDFLETAQVPLNLVQQTDHIVYLSSSCVYPDTASVPTPEAEGFNGEPEEANRGYGWAKRVGELACRYSDVKATIVRPSNIYGPSYDWTNPVKHVIPALVERMLTGESPLVVWGNGQQTRSFMYEDDCALLIVRLAEHEGTFNLGGEESTIQELAEMLADITDYRGEIVYDKSKPEGPARKAQKTEKLEMALGSWKVTPLREGLERTVHAFNNSSTQTYRRAY
jgi:nucleoside-diphosphate-sugar epimerase